MGLDPTVKRTVTENSIRKQENFQEGEKDHTFGIFAQGIINIHVYETHLNCVSGVQVQPNAFLA